MSTGIDLNKMRLSQAYDDEFSGEEVFDQIRVKKPDKQTWFRVHPDESMRIDTALLYWEEERVWYFVAPEIWSYLPDELNRVKLVTCVSLSQEVFLWPIKLPNADGRRNSWTTSAMSAADTAMHTWTRMAADMGQGKYRITKSGGGFGEPSWPEHSFVDLVNLAFAECQIQEKDHPIVKKLRGLV